VTVVSNICAAILRINVKRLPRQSFIVKACYPWCRPSSHDHTEDNKDFRFNSFKNRCPNEWHVWIGKPDLGLIHLWNTLPISYSVTPPTCRIAHSAYSVGLERYRRLGEEMESDRGKWRTSGGRTGLRCGMSELCTFVVNKSLSVEVPYIGRFWLHNATVQITWQLKWVKQRQVEQQQQTTTRVRSRHGGSGGMWTRDESRGDREDRGRFDASALRTGARHPDVRIWTWSRLVRRPTSGANNDTRRWTVGLRHEALVRRTDPTTEDWWIDDERHRSQTTTTGSCNDERASATLTLTASYRVLPCLYCVLLCV